MKGNTLVDSELRTFHKALRYSDNFFLDDILINSYFKVIDNDDYYLIYPLFYSDTISTDKPSDCRIIDNRLIICPIWFNGLFMFRSNDGQHIEKYYLTKFVYFFGNLCICYLTHPITGELIPNQTIKITYNDTGETEYYTIDNIGYLCFQPRNRDFEVEVQ